MFYKFIIANEGKTSHLLLKKNHGKAFRTSQQRACDVREMNRNK